MRARESNTSASDRLPSQTLLIVRSWVTNRKHVTTTQACAIDTTRNLHVSLIPKASAPAVLDLHQTTGTGQLQHHGTRATPLLTVQ